ncbi:MAG TPA: class I SAM-dependent methyltransferase [Solirubrobacterales bacterium]|nr:class I SAM-dependent methyltransferase [Solirubrobacterales bacterium]
MVAAVLAAVGLAELRFSVRFWDGSEIAAAGPPRFIIMVNGPEALARVLREPNQLGLGRAWVTGELDLIGDLDELFALDGEFRAARLGVLGRMQARGAARELGVLSVGALEIPAAEARPRGRRHSLQRDHGAISHHYDVSNDFYRIVLGPSLVYSCAYFDDEDESLESAQARKLDLICRKLALTRGERLLDVGCGWGSLVIHAARRYGVRAVGVTISGSQAELARARVEEAGLADRCEIRLADYRELDDGPYDKIASVGMYEHVGADQLDSYAAGITALLRPGGLFLNHGIARLNSTPGGPKSFIGRYVFPDGELHPLDALLVSLRKAGMEVRDVESLREHYPPTLRRWGSNLAAGREEAVAAAGAERERVWRLYMAGSAHAFERGEITVFQTLAARPGAPFGLPRVRARPGEPEPVEDAWETGVGDGDGSIDSDDR